jgi:hypothetical protein
MQKPAKVTFPIVTKPRHGRVMKLNPISSAFPAGPLKIAVVFLFLFVTDPSQAQVTPGTGGTAGVPPPPPQGSSVIGQPPQGQGSSVIGQPPQGQGTSIIGQPTPGGHTGSTVPQPQTSSSRLGQPVPGQSGSSSTIGSDPSRDRLNRTNREAADIDRDGRLSPEEAARIPPGTPLPR